jgi:uncharacterized LabA/DUF88 family protein
MVFIDGSNLYYGIKNAMGRTDLDFDKFVKTLVGDTRELVRTYYYNAPIDQSSDPSRYKDQQKFFAKLYRIDDFQVELGRLEQRNEGRMVEKGVDIALAVDMVTKAFLDHYDIAILVSGDGDFAKAVQAVKDSGRKVEIAYFKKCYHLKVVADKYISLEGTFLDDCWVHQKKGQGVEPD